MRVYARGSEQSRNGAPGGPERAHEEQGVDNILEAGLVMPRLTVTELHAPVRHVLGVLLKPLRQVLLDGTSPWKQHLLIYRLFLNVCKSRLENGAIDWLLGAAVLNAPLMDFLYEGLVALHCARSRFIKRLPGHVVQVSKHLQIQARIS